MQEKISKIRELKLLFVEDETELLKIISDALDKLKLNFLTASNGKEALEIFEKTNDIDVIITDINMPYLSGLELVKKVRIINPKIPVIVMSAHTEDEYTQQAKEFGINEYLLKPFDFMKFIDIMSKIKTDAKR